MPKSAILKIGASGSLLMAQITLEVRIPARCWMAPEIPNPRYSFGEMVRPVCPIWKRWGRQPASTAARETPTAAPSTLARDSRMTKFSGPLSPRPPDTTISASASSGRPVEDSSRRSTRLMAGAGTVAAGLSTAAAAPLTELLDARLRRLVGEPHRLRLAGQRRSQPRGFAQYLGHHLLGIALPVVLNHAPDRAGHVVVVS